MATKAYFRGYECDYEDGKLTYQGTPQLISCCCCKKIMHIHLKSNNHVYLTCLPCREEKKEKRQANRTRITFVPESEDENDINNS
jgi:hypothetical protein